MEIEPDDEKSDRLDSEETTNGSMVKDPNQQNLVGRSENLHQGVMV